MPVVIPDSLAEALDELARVPEATVVAGGTDVMVEVNGGRRRVDHLVIIDRIAELRSWHHEPATNTLRLGAGVPYAQIMSSEVADLVPALAEAARTVGSPQIRATGTIGGNLGTCSPAGDALPVLAALDAVVHVQSAQLARKIPVGAFMLGAKRSALRPGELITAISVPVVTGWQGYAKVGVRNAMVIATASACLVVDSANRRVRLALGSVGPTILRCSEAEAYAAAAIDWSSGAVDDATVARFGALASEASRPIDDHRSTAEYRRHAVGVLARRLMRRAWA